VRLVGVEGETEGDPAPVVLRLREHNDLVFGRARDAMRFQPAGLLEKVQVLSAFSSLPP
jgi:hypothetical protein